MESKEKMDHFLSLKVMRLTKPNFKTPPIVTTDLRDLPLDLLNEELSSNPACIPNCPTLSIGRMMMIPQSFGNIYLGEVFSSYMFVHNDSLIEMARDVCVRADLQTTSKRIPLTALKDGQQQVCELAPHATIDQVIHHEVKEIGTHILICEVNYCDANGKPMSLKKFYKFHVLKPLDVQTKFYNAESDEVFLEAQIQNLTTGPINLEKVSLEPSLPFAVQSMTSGGEKHPGSGLLQPQASQQFLYCISPINRMQENIVAKNIGILDIVWRSSLGERGHLQTCDLQRIPPDYGDIRLTITDIPNIVKLEQPFTFTCKLSNLSAKPMDLRIFLEKVHPSLTWIGISGRKLDTLEPSKSTNLNFTIVPLAAGLHSISGIRIRDEFANKIHEYDDLTQIFVT